MITLERASKDGDTYTATAPDYITNNEQKTKSNITLETYATDLKQTQVRLTYNDGISDKEPKVLKPKQILFETPQTITFSDKDAPEKYYVYGHGDIQGETYLYGTDRMYRIISFLSSKEHLQGSFVHVLLQF